MKLFIGHICLAIGLGLGTFVWQCHKIEIEPNWDRAFDITYFQSVAVAICFVLNKWVWKQYN